MDNWNKIEFIFLYKLHYKKHEIRELEFWDVETTLKLWQEQVEAEKEEQDKQRREQDKQSKAQQSSMKPPKTTNYGGFNVPKMKAPKF